MAAAACLVGGILLIPTLWPYQQVHDDLGVEREERVAGRFLERDLEDYLAAPPSNDLWGSLLDDHHRHIEG
ncbi:MAG: hypothetical protein R3A46_14200 [Thermomicrobiales bacterium]